MYKSLRNEEGAADGCHGRMGFGDGNMGFVSTFAVTALIRDGHQRSLGRPPLKWPRNLLIRLSDGRASRLTADRRCSVWWHRSVRQLDRERGNLNPNRHPKLAYPLLSASSRLWTKKPMVHDSLNRGCGEKMG